MKTRRFLLLISCFFTLGSFAESDGMISSNDSKTQSDSNLLKELKDLEIQLQKLFKEKKYSLTAPLLKRLAEIDNIANYERREGIILNTWKNILHNNPDQASSFVDFVIKPTFTLTSNRALRQRLFEALFSEDHRRTYDINALIHYLELTKDNNFADLDALQAYPSILYNLLEKEKFELAFQFFKRFYPQVYLYQKKIYESVIISILSNILFWSYLLTNDFIQRFLKPVFEIVPSLANDIFKKLTPKLAEALLYKSQDPRIAQAIIAQNRFPEHIVQFAKEILNGVESSPTMQHLKRYWSDVLYPISMYKPIDWYKPFFDNPALKDLYSIFRKKEQELNKQGYYTFVHGQQRRFYFPERLYTHLWSLRKKQSVDNFFFAHVKDLVDTPETQFEEDVMRKTIHMTGTIQESESNEIDIERRKKVLFMNYAFFANAQNLGSNSADYIIKNKNAPAGREIEISIKEPFTLLGYDWIYNKYQQEIEQLAKDYENLSPFGNMLLVAIPKDKIYKYAYLCRSGGLQQPLTKNDGTKITDIRIALETLLKNPETLQDSDRIEFCLIMTQQKGGLDPSTGIQIYPLLSGDPEKLKVLQAREKILLDKITADVKEAEKQQAIQRAAKITGHVVESAQAK
jgi:hypothetical protein